jgi:curved DNA-binding protein CbpA
MTQINEAYAVMKNLTKKLIYDIGKDPNDYKFHQTDNSQPDETTTTGSNLSKSTT